MSVDLMLKLSCGGCGSTVELYGSPCKHLTLCVSCAKTMAENCAKCYECGEPITRLTREYNVRVSSSSEKNHFIGRFATGLPYFTKKNENKWSMQKEGLQGRHVTDMLREKFKNKPWLLEDETGQFQYHGPLEGSQSATYYFLVPEGRGFIATPAGSWYNFNKVAQYKQLTLEEAEEKIKNRRKTADGYQRWMMKAANNGAAAFGEVEKLDDWENVTGGGRGRKKNTSDEDEDNASDRGDEDEEEESARKSRLGLNKKNKDDDEEGPRGGDLDFDDDDIEKGDDWEHEEIFTDDDEAVGNDPEEREDLAPEIPAPPEIKQDDEDEDEGEDEEGGLSKSGKELKKLLWRANGLNDSESEDDDNACFLPDSEDDISPAFGPKKETPKEEPVDNSSPLKSTTLATGRGTMSTSKSSQGKRKSNGDESKTPNNTPLKKMKTENRIQDVKSVKDDPASSSKGTVPNKGPLPPASRSGSAPQASSLKSGSALPSGPITEDEIRAVLLQSTSITTQGLVARFKSRLRSKEDKDSFAAKLNRIARLKKTTEACLLVLRQK